MSSLSLAARDSSTMLRRNLLHAALPVPHPEPAAHTDQLLLLLFVYIFGDVMSAASAAVLRTAPTTSPTSCRASC